MNHEIKIGDKFNYWTVIAKADKPRFYICRCKCGKIKTVFGHTLLSGKSKSCGCYRKELNESKVDGEILGNKFGRLTPFKKIPRDVKSTRKLLYLCRCDCGRTTTATAHQLKYGYVRSCGCLRSETSANLMKKIKAQGHAAIETSRIEGTTAYSLTQKRSKNNTSGCKGVCRMKNGRYRAYINLQRKQIHVGCFDTLEDAVAARKAAEKEYYNPILEKHKNSKKRGN